MERECESCEDVKENVKEFVYFENNPDEWLCWKCRYPIIKERIDLNEDQCEDESLSGQTGLMDF